MRPTARMVNLTPHPITLVHQGEEITFPPSGTVAKVTTEESVLGRFPIGMGQAIPVVVRKFGTVTGLPPVEDHEEIIALGVAHIVSSIVLSALEADPDWIRHPLRNLIFAPDTGATAIRDENGQVRAVTRLVGLPHIPR